MMLLTVKQAYQGWQNDSSPRSDLATMLRRLLYISEKRANISVRQLKKLENPKFNPETPHFSIKRQHLTSSSKTEETVI